VPRDGKRPGRTLGFGLPEPNADPDDAVLKDRLQAIETKLDELLIRSDRKRGRPRDAVADAVSAVSDAAVEVLQKAIEHVLEDMPLGVQVAVNMAAIMDQVVQEFGRLLPVALKAGSAWHYEKQRKVADPARAERSGTRRRRNKIDLSD
jgi:hypothetical protein